MTHFAVLVLTRSGSDEEVERLLAPYDENGEWFAEGSRWDWWVVGGRFTGLLSNYDPTKDPLNVEPCRLCHGTGRRPDADQFEADSPGWIEWSGGCNGCRGKGKRLKWPSDFRAHDGDRQLVSDLQPDEWRFVPGSVVTPDGHWLEKARPGWFGTQIENERGEGPKPEEEWAAIVRATLEQHPEATAVVVDCHV